MYIGLGGCCASGFIERRNKLINEALPFDFIRTKFTDLIYLIENNFEHFLPPRERNPDKIIGDLYVYNLISHAFYHHDLRSNDIYDAFIRRIERFKNYILNNSELVFYRVITSKFINDETNEREKFYNVINKINPNLKYKLIFIGFINDDKLTQLKYLKLDNISSIFINPTDSNDRDNHCINFSVKCIELYKKYNYNETCKIDLQNNEIILNEIKLENNLVNTLFLDNYEDF